LLFQLTPARGLLLVGVGSRFERVDISTHPRKGIATFPELVNQVCQFVFQLTPARGLLQFTVLPVIPPDLISTHPRKGIATSIPAHACIVQPFQLTPARGLLRDAIVIRQQFHISTHPRKGIATHRRCWRCTYSRISTHPRKGIATRRYSGDAMSTNFNSPPQGDCYCVPLPPHARQLISTHPRKGIATARQGFQSFRCNFNSPPQGDCYWRVHLQNLPQDNLNLPPQGATQQKSGGPSLQGSSLLCFQLFRHAVLLAWFTAHG